MQNPPGNLPPTAGEGNCSGRFHLKAKIEISFSVFCPGERPNIEIGVTQDPRFGPRIETWDDTLVLTSKSRFAPILKMTEDTKQVDLRLFWDQQKKTIKVCSANGDSDGGVGQC